MWLHRSCRMVLGRLGFGIQVHGDPPQEGLLVSNHLSYLDILLYGAILPCVFVAKQEVRAWPMLGLLAALGGTVFIDRATPASAAAANVRIQQLLAAGIVVLIFPEGTSSDGTTVLRFHPSLFEPAVRTMVPVTAAAIQYSAAPHATEKDLCYYGDISFGPHLLQTLQLPAIHATVCFASPGERYGNRKQTAAQTRDQVAALREQISGYFNGT
jgi:lyso-ornithine lipid O-acyltransferase